MSSLSNTAVELSCVIVNYNAGSFLRRCVESWMQTVPNGELIIIDNASSDGSLDFLKVLRDAPIRVQRNSLNLGFSKAVNQGLRLAPSGTVLLLNPDCVCAPGAVDHMVDVLKADPKIGMVGPLLANPDGTEQAGGRRAVPTPWRSLVRAFKLSALANRFPRLFSDFLLHTEPVPDRPIEVEAISGACMLLRREALEEVGLLDEGYFMHCEDLDWCMRFRKAHWKILFVPNAKIVHYKGTCSHTRPIFVEWHKHKGMMRFYRKFFRHQYPGLLMWLVALGVWLRFGAVAAYYSARHVAHGLGLKRRELVHAPLSDNKAGSVD